MLNDMSQAKTNEYCTEAGCGISLVLNVDERINAKFRCQMQ